jgi:hypothetical protein
MGNKHTGTKTKPVICPEQSAKDFTECTFEDRDDCTVVKFGVGDDKAYFLPWKDSDKTEAIISKDSFKQAPLYFFTADLSGCSIWFKQKGGNVHIIHEARTYITHSDDGYKLIINSNNDKSVGYHLEDKKGKKVEGMEEYHRRKAICYNVYALLKSSEIEFRIQKIESTKITESKTTKYKLMNIEYKSESLS